MGPALIVFLALAAEAATPGATAADKQKVFEGNAFKVYPRLKAQIAKQTRMNA